MTKLFRLLLFRAARITDELVVSSVEGRAPPRHGWQADALPENAFESLVSNEMQNIARLIRRQSKVIVVFALA